MADTLEFRGDAEEVLQVDTSTISGTFAPGDTVTATINSKTATVTLGTDITNTQVALALQEMLSGTAQTGTGDHVFSPTSAQTLGEFAEITWTSAAAILTGTGKTERPFIVTSSKVSAAGVFGAFSTDTVAKGPSHVIAENFRNVLTGANKLPVATDTVVFRNITQSLLYELDALSGVTLAELIIEAGYTGEIGLAKRNKVNRSKQYDEYRVRFFTVGATIVNIGQGTGVGSSRVQLDLEAVLSAVNIYRSGNAKERDVNAIQLLGTNASNTLNVTGQSTVDVARDPGQLATFLTVDAAAGAAVRTSAGTTLTTVTAGTAARVQTESAITTLNSSGTAQLVHRAGNIGTANADTGGLAINNVDPLVITKLNLGAVIFDLGAANAAVTITNTDAKTRGATISDPNARSVWSNAIDTDLVPLNEMAFNFGPGRVILPT